MNNANWHLPLIKGELERRFFGTHKYELPKEPSAYSVFVIEQLRSAIQEVVANWSKAGIDVNMVALRGPVAFGLGVPFHREIEGRELPPQLFELTNIVYSWLFSSLGKSCQYSGLRLLDKRFSTEILMDVYLSQEPFHGIDGLDLRLKEILFSSQEIFFPLSISLVPPGEVDIEHLLASYVIFGWDQAEKILLRTFQQVDRASKDRLFRKVSVTLHTQLSSPSVISDIKILSNKEDNSARLVNCYQDAAKKEKAIFNYERPANYEIDDWWKTNEAFFHTLMSGEFDVIEVKDATKRLGDKKGEEKDNQYTLCKVLGLQSAGVQIPAERIVLKLRGFSWYRGEIHNIIDLLKEYASYNFIYSKADDASRYFLHSGPLLFSCEKLNVPFEISEKSRWVGLFLEEMTPPKTGRTFTCRVRRLSDFWALGDARARILREASENDVQINPDSLTNTLKEVAKWLWINELSLDYCDLTLFLTTDGEISSAKIIDLERLAFGELVNEEHPILDCLIDVKSYLLPEAWHETLQALYFPLSGNNRFLTFAEIKQRLRIKGRKRWMIINALHRVSSASRWLGPQRGTQMWRSFLNIAFKLASSMNPVAPQGR